MKVLSRQGHIYDLEDEALGQRIRTRSLGQYAWVRVKRGNQWWHLRATEIAGIEATPDTTDEDDGPTRPGHRTLSDTAELDKAEAILKESGKYGRTCGWDAGFRDRGCVRPEGHEGEHRYS